MNYLAMYNHFMSIFNTEIKDRELPSKRSCLKAIITLRFLIRNIHQNSNCVRRELHDLKRKQTKLKKEGIDFILLNAHISVLEEDKSTVCHQLSAAGDILFRLLNTWQNSGASFKDLCDLCGKDHDKVVKEIPDDVLDMTFGDIMFITYLDYPEDGKDFIQLETDAPFTQAIREYMTDWIIHDPVGCHATDKAFQECFPGALENFTQVYTDENHSQRRNLFELF